MCHPSSGLITPNTPRRSDSPSHRVYSSPSSSYPTLRDPTDTHPPLPSHAQDLCHPDAPVPPPILNMRKLALQSLVRGAPLLELARLELALAALDHGVVLRRGVARQSVEGAVDVAA